MFFLCGFADKVCDAVEVAGKNVMSTTSVVTTGLVSNRYLSQFDSVLNAQLHHHHNELLQLSASGSDKHHYLGKVGNFCGVDVML